MTRTRPALCLLLISVLPSVFHGSLAGTAETQPSPYAGQDTRPIKSPSANDILELRRGSGWGLAKPAELNSKPGPAHRLELKDETGGNFLWSKCQDRGKSCILFSHNIFLWGALSSIPTGNRPESAQFEQPRRYVVQIKARGPRPTFLTPCYHWICITPCGMCTRRKTKLLFPQSRWRRSAASSGKCARGPVAEGEHFIADEQDLEKAFGTRTVTDQSLLTMLAEIGEARTALRYTHLLAHLKPHPLLTYEQIARYNALRGYARDPCDNPPQGHDPQMWRRHNGCD